jgi:hypothetical protein
MVVRRVLLHHQGPARVRMCCVALHALACCVLRSRARLCVLRSGKTSLARAMGALFHSLGLLAEPDVIEKTASTLQTGYVGQAGGKLRACLDEALGRVLLIDEAHTLGASRGTFNDEIVSELAACLTSAKYANRLVVVLAGYEDEARVAWLAM